MKGKQIILLFLALLLPVCIFIFLRMFGKNEFDVQPLFVDTLPPLAEACPANTVSLPYHIPDTIVAKLPFGDNRFLGIYFGNADINERFQRVINILQDEPVHLTSLNTAENIRWKTCVFFLKEPFDVVLVDRKGAIRGQYNSTDREEIDRLMTELTILLKRY